MENLEKHVSDFGDLLRRLRDLKGYSRKDLSMRLKISENTIITVENGKTNLPSEPKLREWLKALGIKGDKLRELIQISRNHRLDYSVRLKPREPANPDIVRLIQTYKYGTISDYDRAVLKTVCRGSE